MPGSLCSEPERICVGSQLGSDHSCLPGPQFSGSRASAMISYGASPRPTNLSACSCPCNLKSRSSLWPVSSSAPEKLMPAVLREKGEAWGGRDRSIFRGNERGIPEASVTAQAPSITELCYWQDLGKDLRFCSLFLANQTRGAYI